MKTALAIFARLPAHGPVKTRLARSIGPQRARDLHRACLLSSALLVDSLPNSIDRFLYATGKPERAKPAARRLGVPKSFAIRSQASGDLGDKLSRALSELLNEGYARVLFLGSDSPTLPRRQLLRAIEQLQHSAAVIGPARDGGFYLVGAREHRPGMFAGVDWGSDKAYVQTVASLRKAGLRAAVLPGWYDVDRAGDLASLERDVRRQPQVARFAPLRRWFDRTPR